MRAVTSQVFFLSLSASRSYALTSHLTRMTKDPRCCDRDGPLPDVATVATWDQAPRIDCADTTRPTFAVQWEVPRRPVVLSGCAHHWPAQRTWTAWESLHQHISPSSRVKATFDPAQQEWTVATWDDVRQAQQTGQFFYIFDQLRDDTLRLVIESDYTVPPPFEKADVYATLHDFPPHYGRRRWWVAGVARSGTEPHVDPSATDAWNTVLRGYKWWIIYPDGVSVESLQCEPTCSVDVAQRTIGHWYHATTNIGLQPHHGDNDHLKQKDNNASSDSTNLTNLNFTDYSHDKVLHVLQKPGETLYIPHGRVHAVYNFDDCVGVTENYAAPSSVAAVWQALVDEGTVVHRRHVYWGVWNAEQRQILRQAVAEKVVWFDSWRHLGVPGVVVHVVDTIGLPFTVLCALILGLAILYLPLGMVGTSSVSSSTVKRRVVRRVIRKAKQS